MDAKVMTRPEFDAFLAEARSRGFSHVITAEGPVILDKWRPYGMFTPAGQQIEDLIPPLSWINTNQAWDFQRPDGLDSGIWGSVWTFLPEKRANEILEFESQLNHKRRKS